MRLCSTSSRARRSISARGISRKQGDGIVIELPPAHRIEIAKQTAGVVVPAPPQIARQRPQPLLSGRDKAVQSASFADHRAHLGRGLAQHADFVLAKHARRDGLHHQHSLQHAAIDQGNAQERLVCVFAGFTEIFEAGMVSYLLHSHRSHSFRDQARQTFMQSHAQGANALGAKSQGRGQHQVGPVRLQQVCGTDVGLKALGDQSDDIHQRFGRVAALGGQVADFFQGQDVIFVGVGAGWLMF